MIFQRKFFCVESAPKGQNAQYDEIQSSTAKGGVAFDAYY
jgi:hypothetical protein